MKTLVDVLTNKGGLVKFEGPSALIRDSLFVADGCAVVYANMLLSPEVNQYIPYPHTYTKTATHVVIPTPTAILSTGAATLQLLHEAIDIPKDTRSDLAKACSSGDVVAMLQVALLGLTKYTERYLYANQSS